MSISPGDFTGAGSGILGQYLPVGAGDYVPLPNQPADPLSSAMNDFAQGASNPTPKNQTLVYSPDVRIIIAHGAQQVDISADIIRGTLIRKENSASTLIWECHNKGLRYTRATLGKPAFSRMDRVTCYMKRVGIWLQVFSGYLDSVPFLQLYPSIVQFKATCTLKRLLNYWWNPGLPDSMAFFNQYMNAEGGVRGDGQGGPQGNSAPVSGARYNDSGLGSMLRDILVKVGHWDPSTVHIENFPSGFMDLLEQQMKHQKQNQDQADNFKRLMGIDPSTPAPGAAGGYNSGAGAPGPVYTATGAGAAGGVSGGMGARSGLYVQEIVAATDLLGMGPNTNSLTVASGLTQAATAGEGSRDRATSEAFRQTQTVAKNYQTALTNSDAAILAVACGIVESGLRVLSNPAVPASMNIPNDGEGHDGTSTGIFQQIDGGSWGSLEQRMNPRQSATMFLNALNKYDWRNADPGTVVWQVQRAGDRTKYIGLVNAAIPTAAQMVQAYRQSKGSASSTVVTAGSGSAPAQAATALAPALGVSGTGAVNTATSSPNIILADFGQPGGAPSTGGGIPGTTTPGVGGAIVGRPNPDSEGAIAFIAAQIGKPYVWGGTGPNGFDCSGLMWAGFRSIGLEIGRDTIAQAGKGQRIAPSNIQRGDTLQCNGGGHTMMWLGDGTIIEASQPGQPIMRRPAYTSPAAASGIFRFCSNGGPLPGAPYGNPYTGGPGMSPSSALAGSGAISSVGFGSGSEPIAQNLFSYIFTPEQFISDTALMYSAATPEKDFINAQPLIQAVQSIAGCSLRNFASAPNGDFIAYYPDFFGMDGKPAVFFLEDIELKDCTLNFSDDSLATHVYVNGDLTMVGEVDATYGWLQTMGYATVENEELFRRMRRVAPGDVEDMSGKQIMRRFGVRPIQISYAMAGTAELEFLLAVRIFMEKWAAQYQSSVSMTFLPDLFPGMRVLLNDHHLQFYVQEVTHTFDFEQGFSTQCIVTAPSNPNVRNLWQTADSPVPATVPGQPQTTVVTT